ncbi:MAG TPA: PBP1A family penicillin-binding protein [Longimicrobium sp.]|nr:PBP1A family penicillin-binding protein [Longimicrobium sp.]
MKRKILIGLSALATLGLIVFGWLWFAPCGLGGCAPVSELERYQSEGSQLLDMGGRPFATLGTGSRRVVPVDSLPPYLPRAFLAVEDKRFYEHGGVDWKRFMGALFKNVKSGGVEEGGSTISMQLARNLFPRSLPYRERSIRRKFMEMRVARQIERRFEKDKILELYLNHIYLGEGSYGVDAAAQEYFGKPATKLTLAEAAVLGGLPVSPSRINPREDLDAALRRRNLVLREMARAGYVSQADADAATRAPLRLARRSGGNRAVAGAWFIERVRRELDEALGGSDNTAGLRVFTTFDPAAQRAAEAVVARQAAAIESGAFGAFRHPTYATTRGTVTEEGDTPYLQGAAIVMEASTGEIRALVGGRDYADSKFDRVFQASRQPGSAFKPFVYLTALIDGVPPSQIYQDQPVKITLTGGRTWSPRNYTGEFSGPLTVREALTRSKNTVTVQIAQEVGMSSVIRTAHDLGLSTPIPNVPATALGAAEVKPIELVRAYAAFDNGGLLVQPHVIRRVEDQNGAVIWEPEARPQRAIQPEEAFVLTSILRDVVDRGTGTPARAAGFRGPAAGKTGTTNGATDVWFVGYTPDLVASVWFGFDRPVTILANASGGTLAAPVWARIMNAVYRGRRMPAAWSPPGGVVTAQVDRRSGMAVDASCPGSGALYTEYFIHRMPPAQMCYPNAAYPSMAMGDTAWHDDEAGAWSYVDTVGTSDLERRGITWPALEEKRRREATGAPPPPPLPGNVEDPYGTAPRGGMSPSPPPAPPPPRLGPPPGEPPVAGGGRTPRRPRVIGQPVDGSTDGGSAPPPVKPDTAGHPG